jgi:hypothetical protein
MILARYNRGNDRGNMAAQKNRTMIITIAIVVSLILYFTGVFSGLYANKIIEKKTTADISNLKNQTSYDIANLKDKTSQDLSVLSNYIKFLDGYLKNIQLEQSFVETLSDEEMCNFTKIAMDELNTEFSYYWERLPFRIEEYELNNPQKTDEYILLKQQYTQLSMRTWILAKNRQQRCQGDLVPILYFYTSDCVNCVKQGEMLDDLTKNPKESKSVLVFTVDMNSDLSIIRYLKVYYNIEEAPALLINGKIYYGRIFTADELRDLI